MTLKLLQVLMKATPLETFTFQRCCREKEKHPLALFAILVFLRKISTPYPFINMSMFVTSFHGSTICLISCKKSIMNNMYIHVFKNVAIWKYTWNACLLFSHQRETLFDHGSLTNWSTKIPFIGWSFNRYTDIYKFNFLVLHPRGDLDLTTELKT